MEGEIKNRVAQSTLVTFDLEDLYPSGERVALDVSQWLEEGLVLREKKFREVVNTFDFSIYKNQHVALFCATDAIVPVWAYMLVTSKLTNLAQNVIFGSHEDLENALFTQKIYQTDFSAFKDKNVMVKGCFNKPVPASAFVLVTLQLQKHAKAVFYGEACSSVPIYKKQKPLK